MAKAILFTPSDEVIDRSLDARRYVKRLAKCLELEWRGYEAADESLEIGPDVDSVAVLAGLSALEPVSGYMEMDLDTIFQPEQLLKKLRASLPDGFPVVAIVDDAYSDYIMTSYLKAGASAVVGTSGDLFGIVTTRVASWEDIVPYINAYHLA